jgi:cell division septation protein DedD
MRMRRPLTLLLALALGVACAVLVACGSSSNPHLLSSARADRLQSELDAVRDAVDAQDCEEATRTAMRLQDEVNSLPARTDPRLVKRLQDGAANLSERAVEQCQQTETTPTTTTTTTTETTPPETTTTETTTTETTPKTETETTPTTTTTTPTTTTTTPTTTSPGSGGSTVPPGD